MRLTTLRALDPREAEHRRGTRARTGPRSWNREDVTLGAATDPYQPAEARYRLTRALHRRAGASGRTPFAIVTRGPLVVRDLDVLQAAAARGARCRSTSRSRRWTTGSGGRTEPGTAPHAQRLAPGRALADAGIEVGVGMAPILPGPLRPPRAARGRRARRARSGRAQGSGRASLTCEPGTREHFLEALAATGPSDVERYERLFA